MLRSSFICAGALLTAVPVMAQQTDPNIKLKGPVRDAGTYHLSTGTWTRANAPQANFGPLVIYDNTAPSGYYYDIVDSREVTDGGRIPGTTSVPAGNQIASGDFDTYIVNGFQLGYCTSEGQTTTTQPDFRYRFYDNYVSCADGGLGPDGVGMAGDPNEFLNLNADFDSIVDSFNMPGTFTNAMFPAMFATFACWTFTVDTEGTASEFLMGADGGDGLHDQVFELDGFGWSMEFNDVSSANGSGGPFMAGDPSLDGEGTSFSGTPGIAGSGLDNADSFWTDDAGGTLGALQMPPVANAPGCYFFGGFGNPLAGGGTAPMASFHMAILADDVDGDGPSNLGTNVCITAPNSNGSGATLSASGSTSVMANDMVLTAAGASSLQPGIMYYGTFTLAGISFGEGFRCAGGQTVRLLPPVVSDMSGNLVKNVDFTIGLVPVMGAAAIVAGTTHTYQAWFRDPACFDCNGDMIDSGFNLSDGLEITYTP